MAARNVDPDYFEHPSVIAYVLLPVTWVLLPMSGYAPQLLEPYVSAAVYDFLLAWSPFLKLGFLLLLTVHAFEVAYCGARCLALGFTPLNSARWMVSVAANGVFSLSLMPAVRSNKKGD